MDGLGVPLIPWPSLATWAWAKRPPHASLRRAFHHEPLPGAPSPRLEGAGGRWRYSKQCRDNLGQLRNLGRLLSDYNLYPCVDMCWLENGSLFWWNGWICAPVFSMCISIYIYICIYTYRYVYVRAHLRIYTWIVFYWNIVPQTN